MNSIEYRVASITITNSDNESPNKVFLNDILAF